MKLSDCNHIFYILYGKYLKKINKSVEVDMTETHSTNLILQACCCICRFILHQTQIFMWPLFFSLHLNFFY